jgi:hypothetical protein
MKELKTLREVRRLGPGWAERRAHRSEVTAQTTARAETPMQTDAPPRKPGGRLSRDDQRRLGDILQRVYDDVIKQGVPDRFRNLLDELDQGTPRQPATMGLPRSEQTAAHLEDPEGSDEDAPVTDPSTPDKRWADPGRNGSQ